MGLGLSLHVLEMLIVGLKLWKVEGKIPLIYKRSLKGWKMKNEAENTGKKPRFKYVGKRPDHEYRKIYGNKQARFWDKAWKAYKRGDLFFKFDGESYAVPRARIKDEEE